MSNAGFEFDPLPGEVQTVTTTPEALPIERKKRGPKKGAKRGARKAEPVIVTNTPRAGEPPGARDRMAVAGKPSAKSDPDYIEFWFIRQLMNVSEDTRKSILNAINKVFGD